MIFVVLYRRIGSDVEEELLILEVCDLYALAQLFAILSAGIALAWLGTYRLSSLLLFASQLVRAQSFFRLLFWRDLFL